MASENIFVFNKNRVRQPEPKTRASGIPLTMADSGSMCTVSSIRGKDDTRRFLTNLGFVEGAKVAMISEMSGNVIVNVNGTRVAISKSMASRILTN